jgi:hypothetical protein
VRNNATMPLSVLGGTSRLAQQLERREAEKRVVPKWAKSHQSGRASRQLRLPPPAPPSSIPPAPANQAQDEEEDDRAYKGIYDQGNDARAEMDAKSRQQPIANESTEKANYQIADETKPATFHHSSGQPTGNNSDEDDD